MHLAKLGFSIAVFMFAVDLCFSADIEPVSNSSMQLQRSSALAAIRYIEIFDEIRKHPDLERTQKSLDWWIDLSILELASLEVNYPEFDWGRVDTDSSGTLQTNRIYKQIANYRIAQPRIHDIPMQEEQIRLIQEFTQKYK